jgi:hypothetical protein
VCAFVCVRVCMIGVHDRVGSSVCVCAWLNACVGDDGVADQSTSPLAAHCRPHHIPELVSLQRSNRASSNVAPLKHAPPTNATLAFLRELTEESGDWEFYFQAKKQFHRKVRSGSITVRHLFHHGPSE